MCDSDGDIEECGPKIHNGHGVVEWRCRNECGGCGESGYEGQTGSKEVEMGKQGDNQLDWRRWYWQLV